MTEAEASQALRNLLANLGVGHGDTVFLGIDMGRIPLPRWPTALDRDAMRERADRWCRFLFDHLIEAVGPRGTLAFPTYTYSCGNPANAFVAEETPSEVGPFTDWLRRRPEARRSIHPIFSVGAIGANAASIVDGTSGSAFGPASPFGRLAGLNASFVSLGVPFHLSVTYLHHLEQCYGCNHRYHKVFTTPVFKSGVRMPGPFLGYMRWLGVDVGPDFRACEQRLLSEGVMREIHCNGGVSHAVRAADIDRIGYAMLAENPCAFASRNVRVDLDETATAAAPVHDPVAVFKLSVE
jgi:aminoglycoside 3-N-acetyltransferase